MGLIWATNVFAVGPKRNFNGVSFVGFVVRGRTQSTCRRLVKGLQLHWVSFKPVTMMSLFLVCGTDPSYNFGAIMYGIPQCWTVL